MSKLGLILVALLTGCSFGFSDTLVVNPKRTVTVLGEIGGNALEASHKLLQLGDSKEDVYLIINSPGGSINAGDILIDAMEAVKSRGIKIKCVTTIMTASMAYSIYMHCDERFATSNALLLYHPARVSGNFSLTDADALEIGADLKEINLELLDYLEDVMGMDRALLEQTFYREKLWKAHKLVPKCRRGFITIVGDIQGVDSLLYNVE